jgi:catechol 2,3-dioxygenase-like lactoylglutathione lyase family enzyme
MGPISKRPGIRAIHSVDRIVMTVPGLADAEVFYSDFGLDVRHQGDRLQLRTFGDEQVWAELAQADGPKRLQYLSLGIFAEDQDFFAQKIAELGLETAPHPLANHEGLWLKGPDGFPLQLVVARKASPSVRARAVVAHTAPGAGAAHARSKAPRVRPRHLSHALLFSTDVLRAVAFYRDVLGLRLSDHSGSDIAFMHGAHGSDHHLIALAKSHATGLHHLSWDVGSLNEVGLGGEYMKGRGHTRGWGVGRHVVGSNYFYYVRDPWGSWCEYSFDIDHIPADLDWVATDHPGEDSFYVWGPEVPADFITNHEYPA